MATVARKTASVARGADPLTGADGRVTLGWKTAIASMVGLLLSVSTMTQMTFGTFVPYLIADFGWTVPEIAIGGTILAIMIMLMAPLQGFLIDRFGARPLILISIPLFSIGFAAMALQTGALWQFYLGWLLLPVLGLGLWPASWIRASAAWFTGRLGLAIGIVNVGIGLGAAILPIAVGAIAERGGWRAAYLALGVAALLITGPIAWRWVHEPDARAGSGQRQAVFEGDGVSEAKRHRAFWLMVIAFVLLGCLSGAILINHVNILVERGIARETAVVLQAVLGAAMVVARLGTGWLLDRIHVKIVMPLFAAGAALGFALYACGATGGLAVLCAILMGLVVGAEMDVLGYAVRRYHGRRAFGSLYGLLFGVFSLGSAVGTAGMGIAHRQTGSYALGLGILAAVSLAAALTLTRLGKYRYD